MNSELNKLLQIKKKSLFPEKICLESEFFEIEENNYYKVNFQIKSIKKELWGIYFYNCNNKKLHHDFFDIVFSSPNKYSTFTSYFKPKNGSIKGRLIFQPDKGNNFLIKNIRISKTSCEEVLLWMKNLYNNIPKIKPFTYKKRFLSRTLNTFKKGKKIKIVMLGDSIINDTSNSNFELLLKTRFPLLNVEIIPSIRNSTGCYYFEKENRIKTFVLDYNPDLLMIGGISNQGNVEAIRNVIKQVRKVLCPEIILMSGIFGRKQDLINNQSMCERLLYRQKLRELAEQEKIEFFDLDGQWQRYITSSEMPYEFFLRDEIHPNAFGRLVIAYFLFYFFR